MIGRLRGEIVHKQPPYLLLEVNGVGYELEAPLSTFYDLPGVGVQVTLHTHLLVREDAHVLYAFVGEGERALFRALLKVSGIGAKMALAILSGMSVEEFARCVQTDNTAALVRLPGIGKKTAERLVIEMRDRLERLALRGGDALPPAKAGAPLPAADPADEAAEALMALGYKPPEALRMVRTVAVEGMASEEIIRAALRGAVK
jgi:holliday junction DNA helicase RuvA